MNRELKLDSLIHLCLLAGASLAACTSSTGPETSRLQLVHPEGTEPSGEDCVEICAESDPPMCHIFCPDEPGDDDCIEVEICAESDPPMCATVCADGDVPVDSCAEVISVGEGGDEVCVLDSRPRIPTLPSGDSEDPGSEGCVEICAESFPPMCQTVCDCEEICTESFPPTCRTVCGGDAPIPGGDDPDSGEPVCDGELVEICGESDPPQCYEVCAEDDVPVEECEDSAAFSDGSGETVIVCLDDEDTSSSAGEPAGD